MYLSDKELLAKLADLEIECPPDHPFDQASQVQAASIDLRLSAVFWSPRRGVTIDLLREKAIQFQPRKFWDRHEHLRSQPVVLKPGEMILGRVLERVTIPRDCAGKFTGRSSYSRLGLMVHCTGDFANPGYRGHMPLQLVNMSNQTLKVYPFMSICQLMLVQLTSTSDRKYGGADQASKYMNDDGGPSYWWRDKYIKELQHALAGADANEAMEQKIYSRLADVDAEVLERLAGFIRRRGNLKDQTVDRLLADFGHNEDALRRRSEISSNWLLAIPFAAIGLAVTAWFTFDAHTWVKVASSIFALASFYFVYLTFWRERPTAFLGTREIKSLPVPQETTPKLEAKTTEDGDQVVPTD
jgi:deoxycytidine triphosphate deaminase